MTTKTIIFAGLALFLVFGPVSAKAQGRAYADAYDNYFAPDIITITAGTTLTWTNRGQNPHTVTADNGTFNSGIVHAAGSFSYTFRNPGVYPYYCQLHGQPRGKGMAGIVMVVSSSDHYYPAGSGKPWLEPYYHGYQPYHNGYTYYQYGQYYFSKQQTITDYYGQSSPGTGSSGYRPYGYYPGNIGYDFWR